MKARDNPFSSDRLLSIRYRFPEDDSMEALLRRLEASGNRGAIVGPQGSGKTTLLEDVGNALRRRGFRTRWARLRETDGHRWQVLLERLTRDLTGSHVILFDSFEALGPLRWRRVIKCARHAGGLVVTVHSAGRLPTLIRCSTSPGLLAEIVGRLLGREADKLPSGLVDRLYRNHGGNLRDALRELYDDCASNGITRARRTPELVS